MRLNRTFVPLILLFGSCSAQEPQNQTLKQLIGSWACEIDHFDGNTTMKAETELTFDETGRMTTVGKILMEEPNSSFVMNIQVQSQAQFGENKLTEIVTDAEVTVTKLSGNVANIPNAKLALKDGLEDTLKSAPPETSQILELTETSFITITEEENIQYTCSREKA